MALRGLAWISIALGLCGCAAPSADEIKARFAAYVSGANSCTLASECGIASAACPLGCYVAVRADRQADVEAKAQELVDEYERSGSSCVYGCRPPGEPACVQNRCALEYPSPPDGEAADATAGH